MADAFYTLDDKEKAIALLQKLACNVNDKIIDGYEKARAMAFALYLLSKYLGQEQRYDESLVACNEGIEISEANQAYGLLPDLNFNKAYILYHMGQHDEAHEFLYRAYFGAVMQETKI